jgi:DNA-binding NtrC family response regulator
MSNDMKILLVEDDAQMQLAITANLSREGYDIKIAPDGRSGLLMLEKESFDLVISDQKMPEMTGLELLNELKRREIGTPFIMITAHGTITQAVEAMQSGAADFLSKPFNAQDLLKTIERVLSPEIKEFRAKPASKRGRAIITNDTFLIRVLEIAEAVAKSDATVLVQGESGTGKELIARLIHSSSPRANQPFVAVNCAALPDTLLESELFGHEKGAFTGAQNRKIGKFEMAHGGTILLDEISEMELALQAKLLRVLQEREVDRVGGKEPIPIDVRVVATTNRNIEETVREGNFRADLYYRLNVIPLVLPPLRERKGDVKLLVEHFMRHYLGASAPALPSEVLKALMAYHWPGNVRELQNAVERAAILSQGAQISERDFLLKPLRVSTEELDSVNASAEQSQEASLKIQSGTTVQDMEKRLIIETLKTTGQNRTEAAKMLGISIRTLRNKLNEYRTDGMTDESY